MNFFKFPTIGQPKKKRRSYDTAQIGLAFKAVKDGMSVYKAARVYGIPESTLRDRHLLIQPVDTLPSQGPAPLFTKEEEKMLVDHLTYMSDIGYGYSRQTFLDMAFEFAIILGKKSASDPSFKGSWFEGFKGRWKDIHLAKPEKLAIVRAKATSKESLDKHFNELSKTYERLNLQHHPQRIWNVDESGILMEHTPPRVLCTKGTKPQSVTSPRGKNVTLIGCGNAAGSCIPPYYIFPGKRWCDDLMLNTCPGAAGEMSETGWSNSITFQNFLSNHFLKYVNISEGQTHLIIFDGHKSHVSLALTNWGKEHDIEFYILPPHTSHVSQPLDVACFGPLKAIYNIECQNYMRNNPGHTVTRYVVGELSSRAYLKAFTPINLVSAFRKTGIYPMDRSKIESSKVMPASIYLGDEESENVPLKSPGEQFLEVQKIVAAKSKASVKRKFAPSTVVGSLSSLQNSEILNKKSVKKSLFSKKKAEPQKLKENTPPCDDDTDESSDDDEEMCCICGKRMPPAVNLQFVVEFAQWAQCDVCGHWTHLKYCSKVKVVRRGSEFHCPHCECESDA